MFSTSKDVVEIFTMKGLMELEKDGRKEATRRAALTNKMLLISLVVIFCVDVLNYELYIDDNFRVVAFYYSITIKNKLRLDYVEPFLISNLSFCLVSEIVAKSYDEIGSAEKPECISEKQECSSSMLTCTDASQVFPDLTRGS